MGKRSREDGQSTIAGALYTPLVVMAFAAMLMMVIPSLGRLARDAYRTRGLRASPSPVVPLPPPPASMPYSRAEVMSQLACLSAAEAAEVNVHVNSDHAVLRHAMDAVLAYASINLLCRPLSVYICSGQNGREVDLLGACSDGAGTFVVVLFTATCESEQRLVLETVQQRLELPQVRSFCALTMFKTDAAGFARLVAKNRCAHIGFFNINLTP